MRLPLLLGSALLLLGCTTATGAAIPLVRVHAATDLDCPGDQIRIEEQMGGRYKAVGCGRKASYRTACDALTCTVQDEGDPSIPWMDRPAPN